MVQSSGKERILKVPQRFQYQEVLRHNAETKALVKLPSRKIHGGKLSKRNSKCLDRLGSVGDRSNEKKIVKVL